jgi:S-adenosylmethionine hydrolase
VPSLDAPASILTLTTDFGTRDHYVGSMKGVLLSLHPGLRIVDITHEVAAQQVAEAGFTLARAFPTFPPGTIHLLVVDPGVGTSRRLLAARTANHFFVAPDNGALAIVFEEEPAREVVSLDTRLFSRPEVSATFHGRDILAPAAARLALGTSLASLGDPVSDWVPSPIPPPSPAPGGGLSLRIVAVDRFGNLITNLTEKSFTAARRGAASFSLEVGGQTVRRLLRTYGESEGAEPFALFNSCGYLEVALRDGSAAALLAAEPGQQVVLRP